jgi:hypothetical protein
MHMLHTACRMRTRFVPVALLIVSACRADDARAAVDTFLGRETIEILRHPAKVETFRVRSFTQAEKLAGAVNRDYPVTATGPTMDAEFGRRIEQVFLNPDTYDFGGSKLCIFDPGVRFRVWSGDRHVDLMLCFHCKEFEFVTYAAGKRVLASGPEDFTGAAPAALAKLAKEAFPDDPEIQALE